MPSVQAPAALASFLACTALPVAAMGAGSGRKRRGRHGHAGKTGFSVPDRETSSSERERRARRCIRVYLPFSPLGEHVGMVPLPGSYFGWLAGILLSCCLLTELVKGWYIRRYHAWL
jgi:hypothetical protein